MLISTVCKSAVALFQWRLTVVQKRITYLLTSILHGYGERNSSSSFIRHNKVRDIKLMKHTVGKTYQDHRALTVAFN